MLDDRTYCVRSAFIHSFRRVLANVVQLFMASFQSQNMCYQTCSIDIFVVWLQFERGTFRPLLSRVRGEVVG